MLPWWKRLQPKNQLELQLERKLYTSGSTRHFVVNSGKVKRELAEAYAVPPASVSVIHTAVNTGHWQPAADEANRQDLRRTLGIGGDAPVLLFASLDHRRKGLGSLLSALVHVPEARLCIAGQALGSWQNQIQRMGLSGRVVRVGRADLLPWYQAADWFVHPTLYDACANTVLQSMACGLPGLISTADGASEFTRDGSNGFLVHPTPVRDGGMLVDVLQQALHLPQSRRQEMGAAARETVLPLTWKAHLEQWMGLISNRLG